MPRYARERRADRFPLDGRDDFADLRVGLLLLGHRPVELGLRDDAVAKQPLHPVVIELSEVALRLDRCQLRALLSRIELGQHVAPIDRPSGVERDAMDGPGQIGADGYSLHRGHGANGA